MVAGGQARGKGKRAARGKSEAAPARKAHGKAKAKAAPRRPARVGRPPGKSSAQTRADILRAAREEFARVGFERATNRAIATGAGITSGAIYGYFESKAELYVAVIEEATQELMPRMRAVVEQAPTARAALAAIVRENLPVELSGGSMRFMATIPTELQRHPELAEAIVATPGTFFDLVVKVVERGARAGELPRDRVEHTIGMFIAGLIGLAMHSSTVPPEHAQAAAEGFIELLQGTLFR